VYPEPSSTFINLHSITPLSHRDSWLVEMKNKRHEGKEGKKGEGQGEEEGDGTKVKNEERKKKRQGKLVTGSKWRISSGIPLSNSKRKGYRKGKREGTANELTDPP
jgi:hypothetical protein